MISLGENALIVHDRLGHEDIETTLGIPNTCREDKLADREYEKK